MTKFSILLVTSDTRHGGVSPVRPLITAKTSGQSGKSNWPLRESNQEKNNWRKGSHTWSQVIFLWAFSSLSSQLWTEGDLTHETAQQRQLLNFQPIFLARKIDKGGKVIKRVLQGKLLSSCHFVSRVTPVTQQCGQPNCQGEPWHLSQGTEEGITGNQSVGVVPDRREAEKHIPKCIKWQLLDSRQRCTCEKDPK